MTCVTELMVTTTKLMNLLSLCAAEISMSIKLCMRFVSAWKLSWPADKMGARLAP